VRFRQIHLKNLFSYRDTRIDLEGAVPGRNIAQICGRNRYGNTSFLIKSKAPIYQRLVRTHAAGSAVQSHAS
jgi:hypothetical protein